MPAPAPAPRVVRAVKLFVGLPAPYPVEVDYTVTVDGVEVTRSELLTAAGLDAPVKIGDEVTTLKAYLGKLGDASADARLAKAAEAHAAELAAKAEEMAGLQGDLAAARDEVEQLKNPPAPPVTLDSEYARLLDGLLASPDRAPVDHYNDAGELAVYAAAGDPDALARARYLRRVLFPSYQAAVAAGTEPATWSAGVPAFGAAAGDVDADAPPVEPA